MKRFGMFAIAALIGLFSFSPAHSQIVNPTNANNVLYTAPYTGAVGITQRNYDARVINASDFGAVCNDSHDDTTAINTAITRLSSAGGGNVILPIGTCKTTGDIVMKKNVALVGGGHVNAPTSFPDANNNTVLKAYHAGNIVYYDYGSTPEDANIGLYDIGLDCNSQAANGVYYGKHRGVRFQRLAIKSCISNGIELDDPSVGNSFTSDLEDVYVNMAASTTTKAVLINTPWAKITRLVTDGGGYSLYLAGGRATVSQSHLEGAGTAAVEIASQSNVLNANIFILTHPANNFQVGVSIAAGAYNYNIISSNRIIGAPAVAVSVGINGGDSTGGINIISGNYISGFNTAISLPSNLNTLTGNTGDVLSTPVISLTGNSNAVTGGFLVSSNGSATAIASTGAGNTICNVQSSLTSTGTQGCFTQQVSFNGFVYANRFANLTGDGSIGYCTDCARAIPCASGGTGALMVRLASGFACY